ncbi:MAG: 7-beta-(4-carbaxybutanamido)cephalosporanic acid acylase [Candidatus Hydrogenedentota bacterium]
MKRVSLWTAALVPLILLWSNCRPATETPAPTTPDSSVQPPAPAADAGKSVTIYRDTWGVPHIYASTDAAAAYGLGYAQAEDRLADLFANVRVATGTAAEAFGREHVRTDQAMQIVRNAEFCEQHFESASPELKAIAESFVAGVKAYMAEHPEKTPEWAIDLQPWHCAAIGRAMIMRWPLGTIDGELRNRERRQAPGASNQWSVAPSRSATGGAILLTDPHLEWEGLAVFYEARVRGEKLHMNGFFLVGSPLLAFGHTDYVGWAPTTGGPDTSDVFEVKIDLSNMLQPKYEIDGQWKIATPRMITVKVKDGDPVTQPTADTELGPVFDIDTDKGVAYIGASPYFDEFGLFEQTYQMLLAKNTDEFYQALGMNAMMEQNIMFADVEGNIQYVRTGRTPVRAGGYDWKAPVPASAATIWTEIHPIGDLVQIKNPPQGYMQNCNISPQNMMKDSPLTPEKYLPYIYNVSWDFNNPRSKRILQLLDADDSVSKEDAMAYAMDVYDILAKPWQEALASAIETDGADYMDDEDFSTFVKAFLAWNGEFTPDAAATSVYKFWRLKCAGKVDVTSIAERKTLPPEEKKRLLELLAQTLKETKEKYGTIAVTWGELHRVGRGGKFFPAPGADFGGSTDGPNFTETLFDVRSREDGEEPGKFIASNGSMATMLMFFSPEGVESYTCTPWGQSSDPESPHYVDQAENLYSKREFKPTWWTKEELMANVKSDITLSIP